LRAVIFVPAAAPAAKIAQLLVYGATVLLVEGTYDDAYALSVQAAEEYGWYCRNTGMNPFTTEGKKTAALEVAEQLDWRVPEAMVVSAGDGNIIAGQHKGFVDLHALGWIDHLPRLIGVQAEGSPFLAEAWAGGLDAAAVAAKAPMSAHTVADSIAAGLPSDRVKGLQAAQQTGGAYVTVSDEAILAAIPELARGSGVFAEPAAAAALAGLRAARERGHIMAGESVVLLITGHGLKDVRGAMHSLQSEGAAGVPVAARMDDVRRAVARLESN
jgi:threonine synthase